ncbi:RnfH family protein [Marinobacter salexigens]|uniref:RnfH family protein n=1 Tax=Marinobacter salexigens TaxID=1925763 RepID=UPI000C286F6A|nr:RnfH family protein [Marinobacter salexigens]
MLRVEVAYARPDKQQIVPVQVPEGSTAIDAVKLSGITGIFPEIDVDSIDMGIFGKVIKKPAEHQLREGDRVELYRPLQIDPKQARLNRAKKKGRPDQ